jgi:hypothetical protein
MAVEPARRIFLLVEHLILTAPIQALDEPRKIPESQQSTVRLSVYHQRCHIELERRRGSREAMLSVVP